MARFLSLGKYLVMYVAMTRTYVQRLYAYVCRAFFQKLIMQFRFKILSPVSTAGGFREGTCRTEEHMADSIFSVVIKDICIGWLIG